MGDGVKGVPSLSRKFHLCQGSSVCVKEVSLLSRKSKMYITVRDTISAPQKSKPSFCLTLLGSGSAKLLAYSPFMQLFGVPGTRSRAAVKPDTLFLGR